MSDDALDQPEDEGYALVMPFVTVASKGGPHDDESYACGWQCGAVDAALGILASMGGSGYETTARSTNLPQLDLIGMKHGFRLFQLALPDSEQVEGWASVRFEAAT